MNVLEELVGDLVVDYEDESILNEYGIVSDMLVIDSFIGIIVVDKGVVQGESWELSGLYSLYWIDCEMVQDVSNVKFINLVGESKQNIEFKFGLLLIEKDRYVYDKKISEVFNVRSVLEDDSCEQLFFVSLWVRVYGVVYIVVIEILVWEKLGYVVVYGDKENLDDVFWDFDIWLMRGKNCVVC